MQIRQAGRRLAANLAKNGNIDEKYIELYARAMEIGLAIILNVVTILIIGGIIGMWWESIVLLALIIPLRSYTGGYHTRNYLRCYLTSTGLLTGSLLFLRFELGNREMEQTLSAVFVIAVAAILIYAPQPDDNRPLTTSERRIFRRRAAAIAIIESIGGVVLVLSGNDCGYVAMMAVVVCACAVILKVFCRMVQNRGLRG